MPQPPPSKKRQRVTVGSPSTNHQDINGHIQSCLADIFQELTSLRREDKKDDKEEESKLGADAEVVSNVTEQQLEEWADFIVTSMNTPGKLYHDADHVLEILDYMKREVAQAEAAGIHNMASDPISKLAILFHDLIYFSLDQKLSAKQWSCLQDVIVMAEPDHTIAQDDTRMYLQPFSKHQDPAVAMVQEVFDMPTASSSSSSQPLPNLGRNEFLSALIAMRLLSTFLTRRQLLQLAMCIEATIPFRPVDPTTGKSPIDRLYDRSLAAYSSFVPRKDTDTDTNGSDDDSFVLHAIHQAVLVGNSDIGVFCDPDPTAFLDSNWRLFPEWFPVLLMGQACSSDDNHFGCELVELQHALASVRARRIDPNLIFCVFHPPGDSDDNNNNNNESSRSFPSAPWLTQKRQGATRNLNILQQYIAIRLLSISLLLEMVELLGATTNGETTIRIPLIADLGFMEQAAAQQNDNGSIRDKTLDDANTSTLAFAVENYNIDDIDNQGDDASMVYKVLQSGRRVNYRWDSKESLFAAMLFQALDGSSQKVETLLGKRPNNINAAQSGAAAREWLKSFPKVVLRAAIEGVVSIQPKQAMGSGHNHPGRSMRGKLFQLLDL